MKKTLLTALAVLMIAQGAAALTNAFPVVDTGQTACYNAVAVIPCPAPGQSFYGQDAQYSGAQPSYTKSSDGLTVKDNVTGLTWQKNPDTNGDGVIDSLDKMTLTQAQARPAVLNAAKYGGFDDWRLPTIKELYSLISFAGTDPSGASGNDTSALTPFIDRAYFDFGYGDTARGERIIDMQYATSTLYVSTTMLGSPTMFGVNFADGRIKGYTLDMSYQGPGDSRFPVRLVRGAVYGVNAFIDNGNSTITDRATGLMWTKGDSAKGLNWQEALAWVDARNAENFLGHNDWRLPDAKELQGIVDYTRSPDTTSSAAIDPLFTCTGITNEAGKADYPFYWTGTTHASQGGGPDSGATGGSAVYIAFGRAMGYMTAPWDPTVGAWLDVHGAGAQRSDPKNGDPADFPRGRGPQGDAIRIYNYVRPVRTVTSASKARFLPIVLDVTGRARYTSELFLANRGTTEASVTLVYTAAAAFSGEGSGTVTVPLPAGHQLVLDDVIGSLRSKGLGIPTTGDQGGSLRVTFDKLSSGGAGHAGVRITSPAENGRAGVSYVAPQLEDLPTTATSWLYGLRSSSQDRTNVAFANASTASPITLRLTLVNGDGTSQKHVFDDVTLGPGQWKQLDDVFTGTGFSQGYASVSVVSGSGPYFAYAVFNDNMTNDGSFAAFEVESAPAEGRMLPVVVETGLYTSEVVLTNRTPQAQTVELTYVESMSPEKGAGGMATETLAAGQQKLLSSILDTLRGKVSGTIGPKGGSYAGTLTARFLAGGSAAQGYAGARTGSPAKAGTGRYGLFYGGVGTSSRAQAAAWVYGLKHDATVRANVAVAASPENTTVISVYAEVYDGATGALVGTTDKVSISPGGWTQWANLLPAYGVTQGYLKVVNETPSASFAAYGVVNDGASPSSATGTDDGSYVPGVQ